MVMLNFLTTGAEKVLMHAFDGKPANAMEGIKVGFFFSIPPSIARGEQVRGFSPMIPSML
jgi:TatD DNase family protein